MAIKNSIISSSGTNIFVCPGTSVDKQEHAVTCLMFCNTGTDIAILTLHAIPSGSVMSAATTLVKELAIPPAETFTFDSEKVVLESQDKLFAIASNSALAVTVSSMRVA